MTALRPGAITPGFIAHAAPEAIAYHLAEARKAETAWSRHCVRLSALLGERLAQVESRNLAARSHEGDTVTTCAQELCPNWSGDGDVCPCSLFDLDRPRPGCGHTSGIHDEHCDLTWDEPKEGEA